MWQNVAHSREVETGALFAKIGKISWASFGPDVEPSSEGHLEAGFGSRPEQNRYVECALQNVNGNGIQCCHKTIYWTNQMRMTFSFSFGGGFWSQPDQPHSHLARPGANKPCPLSVSAY